MKQLYCDLFDSDRHWAWFAELGSYAGGAECWFGQKNGLIGTSLVNQIAFKFGPHTGAVNLRVFEHDQVPILNDSWEEIVESPLVINKSADYFLLDSNGDFYGDPMYFDSGHYRVRLSANKYGISERPDPAHPDPVWTQEQRKAAILEERYELIIWKESLRPDEIIKVTSPHAHSCHKYQQEDEAKRKK